MAKIDLTVIKGTENIVLRQIPAHLHPKIESHPNISLITFESDQPASYFSFINTALSVSDQKTSFKIYQKPWRVSKVAAGINPSLACVMCELANIKPADVVLDPFCGAGTIPISALLYCHAKTAIASDVISFAISSIHKNSQAADINKDKLIIIKKDIADLELGAKSVDKIITNLPFGIRTGDHKSNVSLYSVFAQKCLSWIKPDGLIVLLTQEIKLTKSVFAGFKLVKEYPLLHHGLNPHILIYSIPKPL